MAKVTKKELKELEILVKNYVYTRDNSTCQRCGKVVSGSNRHANHIIPVSGGNRFRFDPLNLITMCFHCHINWWHKNPIESGEWFRQAFPERYEYLFVQHNKADRTMKIKSDYVVGQVEYINQLSDGTLQI